MERLRFKNENGKDYPEWESSVLGRLCNITTGKYKRSTDSGEYVIMDMGSVSAEGRILDRKVTNNPYDMLEKGTLVMPKDDIGGGNIICKTAYIPTANKYVLGDHVYKLTSSVCDTRFLNYRINSVKTNRSLRKKVTGSAQLGINAKNISNEKIRIPIAIQEQEKIGGFLSAIDRLIDKQREKIGLLKDIKKAYLQKIFSQELRFKDADGNEYPSWDSIKLKDIMSVKSKKLGKGVLSEPVKIVELNHIESESGKLLGYDYSKILGSTKNVFTSSNILYGKLRPYLKKYFLPDFDGVCSSEIWVISSLNISKLFLYSLINTARFNWLSNVSTGSKMPRADWSFISDFSFKVPKIKSEQEFIGKLFNKLDTLIDMEKSQIIEKEQLKKGYMQRLFA